MTVISVSRNFYTDLSSEIGNKIKNIFNERLNAFTEQCLTLLTDYNNFLISDSLSYGFNHFM